MPTVDAGNQEKNLKQKDTNSNRPVTCVRTGLYGGLKIFITQIQAIGENCWMLSEADTDTVNHPSLVSDFGKSIDDPISHQTPPFNRSDSNV